MLHLSSFLKEKLIREIKVTKTGFSICPVSITAQESLAARMSEIENLLSTQGACKRENPSSHVAYLISGVPRSYASFDGSIFISIPIIAETVSEALRDLTNVSSIIFIKLPFTLGTAY
ncbi:hypothetical protein K3495_g12687 [Podosphaera aphanis]|nr:hypothetical protein K3495_g12687 [Podosphaera aphanis]